jgi:hypothetical protein
MDEIFGSFGEYMELYPLCNYDSHIPAGLLMRGHRADYISRVKLLKSDGTTSIRFFRVKIQK